MIDELKNPAIKEVEEDEDGDSNILDNTEAQYTEAQSIPDSNGIQSFGVDLTENKN